MGLARPGSISQYDTASSIPEIPQAPQEIFDRAFRQAQLAEIAPTRWPILSIRLASAAVMLMTIGAAIFHSIGSNHVWSGWDKIDAGDLVEATESDRKIDLYHGLEKTREIHLARGSAMQKQTNQWELKSGRATVVVNQLSPDRPFRVRAGGLDLVVRDRAEYTVSGPTSGVEGAVPVTVTVRKGTVHCCEADQGFPISAGEKITLVRRGGESVILAYESE